jgi:hypothetical protein
MAASISISCLVIALSPPWFLLPYN